jgi:tetratricopeptide (TPR) repeat protein
MTRTAGAVPLLIGALVATPLSSALAQGAQQQGGVSSPRLEPTTSSAAAKSEFTTGFDDWQNGSFTTAEKHFRRAIALDSSFGLAYVFAGAIPARSVEALRSGELDRGVALAARASTAEGLLALAWREGVSNRWRRQARILHSAMELLPDEPRFASEYVWALVNAGEVQPALDSVRLFRQRFPSFPAMHLAHAWLALARGDSAEALKAGEEYARLAPQLPMSSAMYGRALLARGRYEEAEAQYRRALALAPARADYPYDATSSLAELYALRGRTAEARAIAMQGLARAVDAVDSALYLAVAAGTSILAGDHRRALDLLASAREKGQFTGRAQSLPIDGLLANANALFGDRRSGATHLARFPVINPSDSSNALAWNAISYGYAGQLDSALAYADHLTAGATPETQWRNMFAHLARGLAYREQRQCAKALGELRQSDSTLVEVQAARAECESQLGNRAAALVWRDRVLARRELRLANVLQMHAIARMRQMK